MDESISYNEEGRKVGIVTTIIDEMVINNTQVQCESYRLQKGITYTFLSSNGTITIQGIKIKINLSWLYIKIFSLKSGPLSEVTNLTSVKVGNSCSSHSEYKCL